MLNDGAAPGRSAPRLAERGDTLPPMQVALAQLTAQLQRGLAPLYVLHGDEALLQQEAADAIRAAARGESVLAPTVAARLMTRIRADATENLSAREIEVPRLERTGSPSIAEAKPAAASGPSIRVQGSTASRCT